MEMIEAKFDYESYINDIKTNADRIKNNTFVHWKSGTELSEQSMESLNEVIISEFSKYDPGIKFTDYIILGPICTHEKTE